jgi:hypothetical protein
VSAARVLSTADRLDAALGTIDEGERLVADLRGTVQGLADVVVMLGLARVLAGRERAAILDALGEANADVMTAVHMAAEALARARAAEARLAAAAAALPTLRAAAEGRSRPAVMAAIDAFAAHIAPAAER